MPDIQEAKCFEFTVQILPPPMAKKIEILLFLKIDFFFFKVPRATPGTSASFK